MEGYSETLDDGELWIPSDIFPVEQVSVPCNNNNSPTSFCCCYSCLRHDNDHCCSFCMDATDENRIRHFAAISLLQQRPIHTVPKPFPITERFRPVERCICTDCSLSGCFERNRGGQLLRTGPPPVYPYQLYPPVQHKVESLIEARARILQMQPEKNRFIRMHTMRKNPGLDRFLPFGGGLNGGSSFGRNYGGTGVFLPRVPINNNGGKRSGGRNRQDVQQNGQRYPCI